MKNLLKSITVFLLLLTVFLSGCSDDNLIVGDEQISEEMDEVISDYLIKEHQKSFYPSEKQFEVHKVYGTSELDGVTTVYLWSFVEGYDKTSAGIEAQSGHSYPLVISLSRENKEYTVIKYIEPQDGELYMPSIEEMFPKKILRIVKQDSGSNMEELKKEMEKKVKEWVETEE